MRCTAKVGFLGERDDGGSPFASEFNNWRGDIILPNLNSKTELTE